MQHLKIPTKKILYLLAKKNFQQLRLLRNSDCSNGCSTKIKTTLKILRGLIKKGLVARSEFGDGYYLTEQGKIIVKPIVEEIDVYKRW